MGVVMGKQASKRRGQADVTYVKPGQLAAITRLRPEPQSARAKAALDRVASRRGKR